MSRDYDRLIGWLICKNADGGEVRMRVLQNVGVYGTLEDEYEIPLIKRVETMDGKFVHYSHGEMTATILESGEMLTVKELQLYSNVER